MHVQLKQFGILVVLKHITHLVSALARVSDMVWYFTFCSVLRSLLSTLHYVSSRDL